MESVSKKAIAAAGGEKNLSTLLATMSPALLEGDYVFCTFASAQYGAHAELEPLAAIQEPEGLTLVIPLANAVTHYVRYESVYRCITLTVHSSLDAVGLTAAFATKLAERGISANVLAGYYHDHLLVRRDMAEQAMAALGELGRESSRSV